MYASRQRSQKSAWRYVILDRSAVSRACVAAVLTGCALPDTPDIKNLPKKQVAVVDGQKLAYGIAGKGTPTIVLISGAGGPMIGWYKLHPHIEKLGTVVVYDRPGVGDSPRAAAPQTGKAAVETLRKLLRQIGVKPPYVLVGHSFGGLHANLFARLHPGEVAGVVFLEATAPEDIGMMKQHQSTLARAVNRLLNLFSSPDPDDEVSVERETVEQILTAPAFPDVPVSVLSGGATPPGWMSDPRALELRERHQDALARLSPRGERQVAAASGHFPQMSEPKRVLEVIAKIVAASRPLREM